MSKIRTYLAALTADWLQTLLLALDLLGLVIFYSPQTVAPGWFGVSLFLSCFAIANMRAYLVLLRRVEMSEAHAPSLSLKVRNPLLTSYVQSKPIGGFLPVCLVLVVEVRNMSVWDATLENVFVDSNILRVGPASFLLGSNDVSIMNQTVDKIGEKVVLVPGPQAFTERSLVVKAKETIRINAQLEFTYIGSLSEAKEWVLEELIRNKSYSWVDRLRPSVITAKLSNLVYRLFTGKPDPSYSEQEYFERSIRLTLVYSYEVNGILSKAVLIHSESLKLLPLLAAVKIRAEVPDDDESVIWFRA